VEITSTKEERKDKFLNTPICPINKSWIICNNKTQINTNNLKTKKNNKKRRKKVSYQYFSNLNF
jgi:hypothetical protein